MTDVAPETGFALRSRLAVVAGPDTPEQLDKAWNEITREFVRLRSLLLGAERERNFERNEHQKTERRAENAEAQLLRAEEAARFQSERAAILSSAVGRARLLLNDASKETTALIDAALAEEETS